jgi:hypothetical protein
LRSGLLDRRRTQEGHPSHLLRGARVGAARGRLEAHLGSHRHRLDRATMQAIG